MESKEQDVGGTRPDVSATVAVRNMAGTVGTSISLHASIEGEGGDVKPSSLKLPYLTENGFEFSDPTIREPTRGHVWVSNPGGKDGIVDFESRWGLYMHVTVRQTGNPVGLQVRASGSLPPRVELIATMVGDLDEPDALRAKLEELDSTSGSSGHSDSGDMRRRRLGAEE